MSHLRIIDVSPEPERLSALRRYQILDTAPEQAFDEVVRLASIACEAPCAALTLVDEQRCWFKARIGLAATETPRSTSFCGYAFKSSGTFVVPDALTDERFNRLPLVTSQGVRFYAGTPLLTSDGHSLGTLCVLDHQPRELSPRQLTTLRALASHAMSLLEQHRARLIPPPSAASRERRCGVLVVDDDPDVLAFARAAVNRLGYEAVPATNGREALEKLREHQDKIELVLTDVNMPVMDGLELVQRLNQLTSRPGIVVMSGRFEAYIRASLQVEGVTNFLGKPFSIDELELTLLQAKAARTAP